MTLCTKIRKSSQSKTDVGGHSTKPPMPTQLTVPPRVGLVSTICTNDGYGHRMEELNGYRYLFNSRLYYKPVCVTMTDCWDTNLLCF